jgi:peroxiredoxin
MVENPSYFCQMKNMYALILVLLAFPSLSQTMWDVCPLKVSDTIPNSEVKTIEGEKLSLNKYVSDKKAVIVFYRGGWCPYCMRHLSALQKAKSQMDSLGYELIAISPDNFEKLDSSIVRSGMIDYTLLSDYNAQAMNDFGLAWKVDDELYNKYKDKYQLDLEWWSESKNHLLPVPAVYVVENGIVQYAHIDPVYRNRLSVEVLLAMLQAD